MRSGNIKINLTKISILLFTLKVLLSCQNPNLLVVPTVFEYFCIFFGIVTFFIKLAPQVFTFKKFLLFLGSGLLVAFTCLELKQYDLVITFLTIYLLKDEDFDEYVRLIFKFQIIMMLFIFCALSVYYFGSFQYIYWFRAGGRLRFTGCMAHPNMLACYILSLMCMYVWLNYDKMTTKKYLMLILVSCISFALTDTRTTFIISICFILFLYLGNKPEVRAWFAKYLKYGFPAVSLLMIYMMVNFRQDLAWIKTINKMVNGRILLGAYAYHRSGITWLPRFLDYAQSGLVQYQQEWRLNTFAFDNIYSFLWVQLGIIWILVFGVLIWKLVQKTDYKCHLYIFIWIIYGVCEVHALNCYRFFPTLMILFLFKNMAEKKE